MQQMVGALWRIENDLSHQSADRNIIDFVRRITLRSAPYYRSASKVATEAIRSRKIKRTREKFLSGAHGLMDESMIVSQNW